MEPPNKKKRALWSVDQLANAMEAVQKKLLSERAAAKQYDIPRRTLKNHLKSGIVNRKLGRNTVIKKEQEDELASRIKRLAKVGVPMTPAAIRGQAYIFCEKNNIQHNFSSRSRRAGKDWLKLFLKRHPDISKRKAQILNPGRAQKLNKLIVTQHFKEIQELYDELDIVQNPQRLYNMDEKGCRLTIHKQPTVLAQKGIKRVHLVAPEHAENVTVAACVNALGNPVPPMVLFKGKKLKSEFTDNLPTGTLVKMAPKGSMNTALFVEFIHHLGKYKIPEKCLLIFDGASCHLDYEIVDAADQHNIVLYCLPSNTTHELQPLDKSVNKSFEHHWDQETLNFFYQNPEKRLTKARFNAIFSRVWSKCMTHENIMNGFKATGLYPYNPNAIPDEAYEPSLLTATSRTESSCTGPNNPPQTTSPTPGPSCSNTQFSNTFLNDSDMTDAGSLVDSPSYPLSPSILCSQIQRKSPPISNPIMQRLVDYSSSDCEIDKHGTPIQVQYKSNSGRPIIYSSNSENTTDDEISMTKVGLNLQIFRNIYSTSSSEEETALQPYQTMCKLDKAIDKSYHKLQNVNNQDSNGNSTDDSDNIPLASLQQNKSLGSSFHELMPTPNYAVLKENKPRRKALNYKGQRVTRDLFKDSENKKKRLDNQRKANKPTKVKKNRRKQKENNDKKQGNSSDKWYCNGCHSERVEDMRQCQNCPKWYHEQCVGLTKEDVGFICPDCDSS